jgi:hypothetical protein
MQRVTRRRVSLAGMTGWILALAVSLCGQARAHLDDFDPADELKKIGLMSDGYRKVERLYYLGKLTVRGGQPDAARNIFRSAITTYGKLSGDHKALSTVKAAESALSIAALTHLNYTDAPLQWDTFTADSVARMTLMNQARDEYNAVSKIGYPRATFEALYWRASLLEKWDVGHLDRRAERDDGVAPIVRAIRHMQLTRQLLDRAIVEFRRLAALEDSLGLKGATGDRDVSGWVKQASDHITLLEFTSTRSAAREEALQALFAERQGDVFIAQAEPLLWKRIEELQAQDAGNVDPFFDFALAQKLADNAFRPFISGKQGFLTAHRAAVDASVDVRRGRWRGRRIRWQRQQEWFDSRIGRAVTLSGLDQLERIPERLDTLMRRIDALSDSLPPGWKTALAGMPDPPRVTFPKVPQFGKLTDWDIQLGRDRIALERYAKYRKTMTVVTREVDAYRKLVMGFEENTSGARASDAPEQAKQFAVLKRAMESSRVVLLDTLMVRVGDRLRSSLEQSRAAAVWMPADSQLVVKRFEAGIMTRLDHIAAVSRSQAVRLRGESTRLTGRPEAAIRDGLADHYESYAARIEKLKGELVF